MTKEEIINNSFWKGWQSCSKMLLEGGTDLTKEDAEKYAAKSLLELLEELKED